MDSCFVSSSITEGKDNVVSSLNLKLDELLPKYGSRYSSSQDGPNSIYLGLRSAIYTKQTAEGPKPGTNYKSQLGVDWESPKGNKFLSEKGQGILGENGEPKVYVDKLGLVYFKLLDGKRFVVNKKETSITERLNVVNAISAKYVENSSVSLDVFLKQEINKNARYINSYISEYSKKHAELASKTKLGKATREDMLEARSIKKVLDQGRKYSDFLTRVSKSKEISDSILEDIKKSLSDSGMAYIEDPTKKEGEDYSTMDYGFLLSSDQVSYQKGMPSVIKALINGIAVEKRSYVGDVVTVGEEMLELMPLLKKVEDSTKVFNAIESVLSGTVAPRMNINAEAVIGMSKEQFAEFAEDAKKYDVFEVMLNKLRIAQVEKDDSILKQVLVKLDDLLASQESAVDREDIRTKFFLSFNKTRVNNKRFILDERKREGGNELIKNINSKDVSNEELKREQIGAELITSAFRILTEKGVDQDVLESKFNLQEVGDRKNFKNYLEKRLGMKLQDKTIDQLIISNNKRGFTNKEFITRLALMTSLVPQSDVINILKSEKKGIMDLAKQYYKVNMNERIAITKDFIDNKGNYSEIREMARLEALNRPTDGESSVVVGDSKRWLYSLMSKYDTDVARWKDGDTSQLEDLRGTGNEIVDFLLAEDVDAGSRAATSKRRLNAVNMKNNVEMREMMDTNPAMFSDLTLEDLISATYSELYESKKEIFQNRTLRSDAGNNANLALDIANNESRNSIILLTNADKSSTTSLTGITTGESAVVMEGNLVTEVGYVNLQRMKNMFFGEVAKINKSKELIYQYNEKSTGEEKVSFAAANLIPGWHFKPSKVAVEGTNSKVDKDYFNPENEITTEEFAEGKVRMFGFLNEFYLQNRLVIDATYFSSKSADVDPKDIGPTDVFDLDKKLNVYLTKILNKQVDNFSEVYGSKNEKIGFDTLPNKLLLEMETNLPSFGDSSRTAANLSANYMFKSIAMFNIFNGEVGMYGQKGTMFELLDALKRTPAPNADGKYARNINPTEVAYYIPYGVKETVKEGKKDGKRIAYMKGSKTIIATVKSQEYDNSHYSDVMNKLLAEMGRDPKNPIVVKGEVADGSTFASAKFLFDYYTRVYGNNEKDIRIHNELLNGATVYTKEHFDFIKKIAGSLQASKIQGFSQSKVNGTALNFFLKTSVMPMYPGLTKGFPIDNLRQKMEDSGVDMVAMDSAVKGSKPMSTTLHKEFVKGTDAYEVNQHRLGEIKDLADLELNPFEINTEDLKVQVELSAKGDKQSTAGNQHMKNILANMDLTSSEKVYKFKGNDLTAKEMYDAYSKSVKDVIDESLKAFKEKITNDDGTFNHQVLRDVIMDQLEDTDLDVKAILSDIFNPIEIIPGMANKSFSVVSAYLLKKVAKPMTNGMAAIQVANYGFNPKEIDSAKNVIMIKPFSELKPPRPTTVQDYLDRLDGEAKLAATEAIEAQGVELKDFDSRTNIIYFYKNEEGLTEVSLTKKDGFHATIEKGQIMIPFMSLFKGSGMTWEGFTKFMGEKKNFDPRVLSKVLGYRIPNQSMSSNDSFEIVGILHPSVGDSAIIYHEITSKTGSDFDIDKMVLMLPNFSMKKKSVIEKVIDLRNKKITEDIQKNHPVNDYMTTGDFNNAGSFLASLTKGMDRDFINLIEKGKASFVKERNVDVDKMLQFFIDNKESLEEGLINSEQSAFINGKKSIYSVAEVLEDVYNAIELSEEAITQELADIELENPRKVVLEKIEYVDDSSRKGLQNSMIEAMTSVLESSDTYDDLISPLDSDYVKDKIQEVSYLYSLAKGNMSNAEGIDSRIEDYEAKDDKAKKADVDEFIKNKKISAMEGMTLFNLAKARVDVLMAKGLTATMANHMSDIPFGQIKKAFLRYDIGLGDGSFARTNVIGKENDVDFKLTKIVSYLMNASVDASKDNYIVDGNYNSYTSGAAMLLIRLGMDPIDVSKIIMNPAIVSLSKEKLASVGKTSKINAKFSQSELDAFSSSLAIKLNRGVKIKPDYFVKLAYRDVVVTESKEDITKNDVLGYWNILVTIAKEMNEDIAISKPDTNGGGESIAKSHAILNLYKKSRGNSVGYHNESGEIISGGKISSEGITEEYFPMLNKEDSATFLEAMADVSVALNREITKGMFIEKTEGYFDITNKIMSQFGKEYSIKEDEISKIQNSLYPFMLIKSGSEVTNLDDAKSNYLLEEFPDKLLKLKAELQESNAFLREVFIDSASGFIDFNNTANYTDNVKKSILDDMASLYQDEDTRDVAIDLVKYSFLTTGFKPSSYGYVDYLPAQYFVDSGHGVAINNLIQRLNNPNELAGINDEFVREAIVFIATNRPKDEEMISTINLGEDKIEDGKFIKTPGLLGKLNLRGQEKNNERFKLFVKTGNSYGTRYLMLTDVTSGMNDKGEVVHFPKYTEVNIMDHIKPENISKVTKSKLESITARQRSMIKSEERNKRLIIFNKNLIEPEKLIKNYSYLGSVELLLSDTSNDLKKENDKVLFNLNRSDASYANPDGAAIEEAEKKSAFADIKELINTSSEEFLVENKEEIIKRLVKLATADNDLESYNEALSLLTNKCG